MKKLKKILILILIIQLLFCGCDYNINFNKKKPYIYYYSALLKKDFSYNLEYTCSVLDNSLYKTVNLKSDDMETLLHFVKSINKTNFLTAEPNLPKRPAYKVFVEFKNKDKYVINVYNEQFISIYPWDGDYSMDYVDMSHVYNYYNIYSLCKYVIENKNY